LNLESDATKPPRSQFPLAGGLLLLLVLTLLLIRAVAAVEAAGRGAEQTVMTGEMTGGPADGGALQTALGVDGRACGKRKRAGENG
jgi:hypothetical protein